MISETFKEFTDDTVLNRLAVLDRIMASDQFLVGLSGQPAAGDITEQFNVIDDLVLGFQLFFHQKKPRVYKGEFSAFDSELGWITTTANYIAGKTDAYRKADDLMYKLQTTSDLQGRLRSMVASRAVELNLAQSWIERPEFSQSRNDMDIEQMLEMLEVIVQNYFTQLTKFAFVADFDKISLCTTVIAQLQCGGVPCGWLSKKTYWDLSGVKSGVDYERGSKPGIHLGVFSDPEQHLAMLYLDKA